MMRFLPLTTLVVFNLICSVAFGQLILDPATTIGGPEDDGAKSIVVAANGDVYVTGFFRDSIRSTGGNVLPGWGDTDVFVAKYASDGSLTWMQTFGSTSWDLPYDMAIDDNGNVYIVGLFNNWLFFQGGSPGINSSSGSASFFVKYNSQGQYQFAKSINGTGTVLEAINAVDVDSNNDVYIAGHIRGTVDFDGTSISSSGSKTDIVMAKYDSQGNLTWVRKYGHGNANEEIYDMDIGFNDVIYVAGIYDNISDIDGFQLFHYQTNGANEVFFAELDQNGDVQAREYHLGVGNDYVYSIVADYSGFFKLATFENDLGGLFNFTSAGGTDLVLWRTGIPGGSYFPFPPIHIKNTQDLIGVGLAVDDSLVYVTGFSYNGTIEFDATNSMTLNGNSTFIAAYRKSSGAFEWAYTLPGGYGAPESEEPLHTAPDGSVYLTGQFYDDFDVTSDTLYSSPSWNNDVFWGKLQTCSGYNSLAPSASGSTQLCEGDSVTLTANATGHTLQWYEDGNPIAGANYITFTTAASGNFTVEVTSTYCNATSPSITVTVDTIPEIQWLGYDSAYCLSSPTDTVSALPFGGTYIASPGVLGGIFLQPNIAGIGTHDVIYTVTDGNGCTAIDTTTFIVFDPNPTIDNLPNDVCEFSGVIALTGTPSGGTFTGPGVSNNQFDPAAAGVGQHKIWYHINSVCVDSGSQWVTVTAGPAAPTVSASSTSVCVDGSPVTLSGTPSGGTFTGTGVSGSSFDPSTAGAGSFTVTYTVVDGNNCSNSADLTIQVHALPTVTISSNTAPMCVDQSARILIGSPTGGTLSGNGISGNLFDPSIAGVGTHTITYDYTDGNNCSASATASITVNPLPTVTVSGLNSTFCENDGSVTMTGTPAGGTFSGPGVTNNLFDPTQAGTGTHDIIYSVTDANNCTGETTTMVEVLVTQAAVITQSGNSLTANQGASYQWYLDGSPINGATGQTHQATAAGTYIVEVTYANGCSDESDGVQVQSTNSIALVDAHAFKVWPNPADGMVVVELTNGNAGDLLLLSDLLGETIIQQQLSQGQRQVSFDVSNLAEGMYLIQLQRDSQRVLKKLVVLH